jgi:hypothetical protein
MLVSEEILDQFNLCSNTKLKVYSKIPKEKQLPSMQLEIVIKKIQTESWVC